MAMQRKVECPNCEEEVGVSINAKNPLQCEECGADFNLVTRTVPIQIDVDPEFMEMVLQAYHKVGQWFMDRLQQNFKGWRIFPKIEGECSLCGETKNLTMEKDGQRFCSPCGKDQIYRKEVKKELKDQAKQKFSPEVIPRKTIIGYAFDREAQPIFNQWLSNKWGYFARVSKLQEQIQECKKKGAKKVEGEPSEITHIREIWRNIRSPISPFIFFKIYYGGGAINKTHRKERRDRLCSLSSLEESQKKKRKCTDLAIQVAEPICDDCEHLEKYEWNWECKVQNEIGWHKEKVANFPRFPNSVVDIGPGMYKTLEDEVKLRLWEKGKWENVGRSAPLHKRKEQHKQWLEKRYHYTEFSDNRYPYLWRKQEGEYYLMYPKRDLALIKPGSWTHILSYGPTYTYVLSLNGTQQKLKSFRHGQIRDIKDHFKAERDEARDKEAETYWDKPRLKEGKQINDILHKEAHRIRQHLAEYPGKVILLNMQKKKYPRTKLDRRKFNQRLSHWADGLFRTRMGYKAELEGFIVEEEDFDVGEKGSCPYCGKEFDKTWQQLIIVDQEKSLNCVCGSEVNLILGIAQNANQQLLT